VAAGTDAARGRKAALASVAFDDGAALPAMAAEDIDFLFGPALDRLRREAPRDRRCGRS
jgi:hypothetical protein